MAHRCAVLRLSFCLTVIAATAPCTATAQQQRYCCSAGRCLQVLLLASTSVNVVSIYQTSRNLTSIALITAYCSIACSQIREDGKGWLDGMMAV
jgi:hypothetical protein